MGRSTRSKCLALSSSCWTMSAACSFSKPCLTYLHRCVSSYSPAIRLKTRTRCFRRRTKMANENPKELIDFFDGTKYDFLSNFHPCPVFYEGRTWRTTEHAYQ